MSGSERGKILMVKNGRKKKGSKYVNMSEKKRRDMGREREIVPRKEEIICDDVTSKEGTSLLFI